MSEALVIENEHAKCYEAKHVESNNVPCLRFYKSTPSHATLQICTFDGIGDYGRGVKRNMLSHLYLDHDELLRLRDAIDKVLGEIECRDTTREATQPAAPGEDRSVKLGKGQSLPAFAVLDENGNIRYWSRKREAVERAMPGEPITPMIVCDVLGEFPPPFGRRPKNMRGPARLT
jgi:hypothetical protein